MAILSPDKIATLATAAAKRYGVDPNALMTVLQIEDPMRDTAVVNPTGSQATGLGQFIPSTARQYGLTDATDPAASVDAAARLMRDNNAALTQGLGRAPTIGEQYLAYQQGANGALQLLTNPNTPASQIVGAQAVTANGGSANMTASQFAGLWTGRADQIAGTIPPADIPDAAAPNSSGSPDDRSLWASSGAQMPFPQPAGRNVLPPISDLNPLPAPAPLVAPGSSSGSQTLAPPDLPLNPPMPPPLPASYSYGPETQNWAPPIASLGYLPQQPTIGATGSASGPALPSIGNVSLSPTPSSPTAPTPAPLPSFLRPVVPSGAPTSSANQVRLPSGKMIAPGNYPASNDGSTYTVSDDGNGNAVVTMNNPGIVNIAKMGPDTVAGGYIGNAISSAIPQVQQNVGTALDTAGSKIGDAVNTAKANVSGLLGGIGGLFGGGGAVAPPPIIGPPPTTTYTPQQMQVANPAYEAYIKAQNADDIGAGPGSFADLTAFANPPALPTLPAPPKLAAPPPRTITITRPAPVITPMATIATGKTVPVGSTSLGGVGPNGLPYSYTVQPDGSIVDSNGRVTATPMGPVGAAAVAAQNNYKSALSGNLNRGSSNSAGSAIMRGY